MRRIMAAMLATAMLAGCSYYRSLGPDPAKSEAPAAPTIRYAAGACFGTCPIYSVTIAPDGHGSFTGERFTAVTGERAFVATPAAYAAFARALKPYRPNGEVVMQGPPLCAMTATDLPTVDVRWTGDGAPAHLSYNYGCDREKHRAMADAIQHAPDLLPIAELIGRR